MKNRAAVFVLLGQSNAVGHGVPMKEEDVIATPLANVYGLCREKNQSFDIETLTWSGYVSGGMNLGEEQDDTYSLANCLAARWQKHIDGGNAKGLGDLYIVQIAIGAQGVTEEYMWYPEREKRLVPGKLGVADISLFSFADHILSLLPESLCGRCDGYDVIGVHWRGGENDFTVAREKLACVLADIYEKLIGTWDRALGTPPVVLHRIVAKDRAMDMDQTGAYLESMHYINEVFDALADAHENVRVFDVTHAPQYAENVRGNGLFIEDAVHFTPEVNDWVAGQILKDAAKRCEA